MAAVLLIPETTAPCTIFMATDGQNVLASNNEDYATGGYDTGMLFLPPDTGTFGAVVVGYTQFDGTVTFSAQGGANDQGLFLDGNAAPWLEAATNAAGDRNGILKLFVSILQECSTVSEAVDRLATLDLTGVIERAKIFIADRAGDAAIYEGDWVTARSAHYLISTNFYESHPELGGYPCWRYEAVEQLFTSGLQVSMDDFALAAEAAHVGSSVSDPSLTHYTNIHDLATNLFRLYYRADYLNPLEFDLSQELANGGGLYLMADLFGAPFASDAGEVDFYLQQFWAPSFLPLTVRDSGPNGDPLLREQVTVTVTSTSDAAGETITLTEIGEDRGVFAAVVPVDFDSPIAGDNRLQVAVGDALTVSYDDADDGTGSSAIVTDQAALVCDLDQDGAVDEMCGGPDCSPLRRDVNPLGVEYCDQKDNDCDALIDESCVGCVTPLEPDITTTELNPNPLACDQCVAGDFNEQAYGDGALYRVWGDAYAIDGQQGDSIVSIIDRPAPNGLLTQILYDPLDQVVATALPAAALSYTFESDGLHHLVLSLSRANTQTEPNAYFLKLHCPSTPWPEPDGGVDAAAIEPDASWPDGSQADAASPDTALPDAAMPDTNLPDTAAADTRRPDTSASDTALPDHATVDSAGPTGADAGPGSDASDPEEPACGCQQSARGAPVWITLLLAAVVLRRRPRPRPPVSP